MPVSSVRPGRRTQETHEIRTGTGISFSRKDEDTRGGATAGASRADERPERPEPFVDSRDSMTERLLGHMQIANDKIQIAEVEFSEDVIRKWYRDAHGSLDGYEPKPQNEIEWFAFLTHKGNETLPHATIVSYAALTPIENNEVRFRWIVSREYRGWGLGKLMARFATDQAIRNRKRAIVIDVEKSNEIALKILEDEEFEVVPHQESGIVGMRKELRWQ